MKKKAVMSILLVGVLAFSLAACGSSSDSSDESSSDDAEEEAIVEEEEADEEIAEEEEAAVEEAEEATEAPAAGTYQADTITYFCGNIDAGLNPLDGSVAQETDEVYERLFAFDGVGGDMYAVLADPTRGEYEGYDHEDGSSDYTIYIRDNIYDHAGNHFTASDAAWSYNYRYGLGGSGWDAFESAEAIDDTTMVLHMNREMTGISDFEIYLYDVYMVCEQAFNDSESGLETDMCGTGPYHLVSFTSGAQLVLEAYEDYWGKDEPDRKVWSYQNVQTIIYDLVEETSQQVMGVQSDPDSFAEVDTIYVDTITEAGDFDVYTYDSGMICCAIANCSTDNIMGNADLRKAVFYAIDLDSLTTALQGIATPAYVFALDSFSDYDASWDDPDSYYHVSDQDIIDEYLEAAGYNGETIRIMAFAMDPFSTIAQVIQNQLIEAGIDAEIITYEPQTYFSMLAEPDEWDLTIQASNSYSYNARFWYDMFTITLTENGMTRYFQDDADWNALLDEVMLTETHTIDNMTAWLDLAYDNAYYMSLVSTMNNVVYPSYITEFNVNYGDRFLPGAFTYSK